MIANGQVSSSLKKMQPLTNCISERHAKSLSFIPIINYNRSEVFIRRVHQTVKKSVMLNNFVRSFLRMVGQIYLPWNKGWKIMRNLALTKLMLK